MIIHDEIKMIISNYLSNEKFIELNYKYDIVGELMEWLSLLDTYNSTNNGHNSYDLFKSLDYILAICVFYNVTIIKLNKYTGHKNDLYIIDKIKKWKEKYNNYGISFKLKDNIYRTIKRKMLPFEIPYIYLGHKKYEKKRRNVQTSINTQMLNDISKEIRQDFDQGKYSLTEKNKKTRNSIYLSTIFTGILSFCLLMFFIMMPIIRSNTNELQDFLIIFLFPIITFFIINSILFYFLLKISLNKSLRWIGLRTSIKYFGFELKPKMMHDRSFIEFLWPSIFCIFILSLIYGLVMAIKINNLNIKILFSIIYALAILSIILGCISLFIYNVTAPGINIEKIIKKYNEYYIKYIDEHNICRIN